MISVITCSINPARFASVQATFSSAFGNELHELIGIHNAKSLAEGYTRGIAQAKGDTMIFSHDDVEILSPDFSARLKNHLKSFDLIGVAGTTRLCNAKWAAAGPPYLFGQMCHIQPDGLLIVDIYGVPRRAIGNIQALDGVFLAARREIFQKVSFDAANFDGFHLYDVDLSYSAFRAGLRVGVVNDINLMHFSGGKINDAWAAFARRFETKWAGQLDPMIPPLQQWTAVHVRSRQHALEVMNPGYWDL